jgi:hypothetical protein
LRPTPTHTHGCVVRFVRIVAIYACRSTRVEEEVSLAVRPRAEKWRTLCGPFTEQPETTPACSCSFSLNRPTKQDSSALSVELCPTLFVGR